MEKTALIILLAFISIATYAQEENEKIDNSDVAFAVIENVPVYPGCENEIGNEALKKCISAKITEHVVQNFNTSIASNLGLIGLQKIYAQFRINKREDWTKLE